MMEALFLAVAPVSAAVSALLLPLLLLRRRVAARYAPQTCRRLWLAVALVLLILPWIPKPQAPVVVPAPKAVLVQARPKGPITLRLDHVSAGVPAGEDRTAVSPERGIPGAEGAEMAPVPAVSLLSLAAGAWLAGMGAVLLWLIGGYALTRRRLLRKAQPVERWQALAREVGIAGRVRFLESPEAAGPMTLGAVRPIILLPKGYAAAPAVLHELYHVKHRDGWYKLTLLLACMLHWFNPLVWLLLRAGGEEAEACCDAAVVAGRDAAYRREYGQLLLSAAAQPGAGALTTRFGGGRARMGARLSRLFHPGRRSAALLWSGALLAALLGSLAACQEKTAPAPAEAETAVPTARVDAAENVRFIAAEPLTERTMPTLDYYDPDREFLLYHTLDTAYFHYGDAVEEFQAGEGRVLWRCDVSGDEQTVYLSHVLAEGAREEKCCAWDIGTRTMGEVTALPDGVDHMTPVGEEELYASGFAGAAELRSNAVKTANGTVAALTVDRTVGNGSLPYLCLTWDGGEGLHSRFLTPERIPGPKDYTDPDWGFTLHLPESMEGAYYVRRAGNSWEFYDKAQYGTSDGFILSLCAEDKLSADVGGRAGRTLGEKGGISYALNVWPEEQVEGTGKEAYRTMVRDASNLYASALDLTYVTRSTGDLWPFPYAEEGGDVVLQGFEPGEHEHIDILAPDGCPVQAMAVGTVTMVHQNPASGNYEVAVAHDDIFSSWYGNLVDVKVRVGDTVVMGDTLGYPGTMDGRQVLQFTHEMDQKYRDPLMDHPYCRWDFTTLTKADLTLAEDPAVQEALDAAVSGERDLYDVEQGKYCNVNALEESDGIPVSVCRWAEVDMDGDGIDERVLWLERGEDEYQLGSYVLRYHAGEVCGYPMGYRSMVLESLKADGTFYWSGGAFNNGCGRLRFHGASAEMEDYTYCDGYSSNDGRYIVDGHRCAREEFDAALERENAKENVVWREAAGHGNMVRLGCRPSMGCTDPNCKDPDHYHFCEQTCTDPSHYHDCPEGCDDPLHHHGTGTVWAGAAESTHHPEPEHGGHGSRHSH